MDRNRLEQEALTQINRGSPEGALKAYLQILKLEPKDRRIRQKVGELLLKLGRPQDAEKHLRDVADSLLKEGAHRAAVSLLKQLVTLRPDDAGLQLELGECYVVSGYANDARQHFDTGMRLYTTAGRTLDAARAARRLSELSPGEPALRLKVAELLEAGGDPQGAAAAYQEVAEEYRRRGRPDEVGRVAEMALRMRPDDIGLLLDAAGARVQSGDWKKALGHLQLAFATAPKEPRTLDLLAQAFEGVEQQEKALKVLLELAQAGEERADPSMEADALRRASRLAPADTSLKGRLAAAEERMNRMERRLTSLGIAQAVNEDELRAQVRAEVLARYGFTDRAEAALKDIIAARPDSLPLAASLAEVCAAAGRTEDALRLMERILPRAGGDSDAVLDRMSVLKGVPRAPMTLPPGSLSDAPDAGDETAEQRGDRLAEAGDSAGAMAAWREALGADPLNEAVLTKIAALRSSSRPPPPPRAPAPRQDDPLAALTHEETAPEDGTFAEVHPDQLDELEAAPTEDLDEARSLVAVGMFGDALILVEHAPGLEARVVYAQAVRGLGDVPRALEVLREATNEAGEDEPGYLDALFELSALYTATGKHRSAVRLLEEIKDLDPGFRTSEVDARMRGLARLVK